MASAKGIIDKLGEKFARTMRAPDIRERYATLGLEATESSSEQLGAFISSGIGK